MSNLPKRSGMRASNDDFSVTLPEFERHGDGERLEGRAHLEHARGQAIDARRIERLTRIVWIVIRLGNHGDDFAGMYVEHDAGGGQRLELGAGGDELVAQRVLHAQIDGKLDGILQAVGGEAGHVQRGEAVAVEPLLHAGDALIVDIDVADDVRDFGTARIVALVLVQKPDAGQALAINLGAAAPA